jgi:TRAP-type mannitol/chloroaromatic compound transport system permease large subunit
VLGSILGGITNPTPAAALGAGGAIMLAAYRKLQDQGKSGKIIIWATFAVMIAILIGVNFDLRINQSDVSVESWIAFGVAYGAYLFALFGLLYGCWVLYKGAVLTPIVRETAKVTSMVFTILIGSQLLNLVVISFGGEHYIQQFLKSFDNEMTVFLIVMLVLFFLGFVLDFLEIIYIVIPIVGPVIYGGSFDPKWVTIMVAVNLQTSFLTPPFGFALFYLRGVAPKEVTTGHIYRVDPGGRSGAAVVLPLDCDHHSGADPQLIRTILELNDCKGAPVWGPFCDCAGGAQRAGLTGSFTKSA